VRDKETDDDDDEAAWRSPFEQNPLADCVTGKRLRSIPSPQAVDLTCVETLRVRWAICGQDTGTAFSPTSHFRSPPAEGR
jgi:hypothetical protein